MKKIFFVFIILIVIVSACINKETENKITKVDSLITETKNLQEKFFAINIDTVNYVFDILNENMEFLKQENLTIPNDSELKNKFANYGTIFKFLKKYLKRYNGLQKEISFSENHLIGLKHDIKNDLLNDSLFLKYYNDEKKILETLTFEVEQNLNKIEPQIDLFFKINTSVEQFIENSKKLEKVEE